MVAPPTQFPFFPSPAPTQVHGCYSPSPFPYPAYVPGPVFPPPPCGFGEPPSGFFPAPVYGPSPFAASSHHTEFGLAPPRPPPAYHYPPTSTTPANPYHFPVQVVVQNDTDPDQTGAGSVYLPYPVVIAPPPASTAPPATDSSSSPAHHTSSGRPNHSLHHHHFPPTSGHLLVQAAPQPIAVPTAPNRERRSPKSYASSTPLQMGSSTLSIVNANPNNCFFMEDDATGQAVAHEHAPAKDSTLHRLQREFLNLQARLDQQQAHERTSFNTIQGEISRLYEAAAHLAYSVGRNNNPSISTTTEVASVSVTSASTVPPATAHVAPQVFGEMPTPTSWQGTHGTALNNSSGHHNATLSTCVPDGNNSLSEPNLDGMPQAYGLHNLNRRSVSRADGTKHVYYALPDSYHLQEAVPEPVFVVEDDKTKGDSNDSALVFATTPEQLPYVEEQQESDQLLKCLSKALETEHTSPCLDIISDVSDSTLELQQQDDEMECNSPVTKASDSTATRSSQLCIEHSMRELRLLWDPGASTFLVTTLNNGSSSDTIGNEHVVGRLVSSTGGLSFHDNSDLGSQYEQLCIVIPGVFNEVMLDIPPTKPPENKQFSALQAIYGTRFLLEAIPSWQNGVFSLGSLAISALRRTSTPTGDKIYGCLYPAAKSQNLLPCISTRDTEHICIFVKLSPWSIRSAQQFQNSAMKKGSTFPTECTLSWNPWYAILLLSQFLWEFSMEQETQMPWDPRQATIAMTCEHATTCWGMVCMEMHCCSTTVYVTQHMHALEFSLMVTMLPNGSESTDGQLAYMPQGASSGSSEWVRPMVIVLSCWFPSFEMAKLQYPGIGTPSSIYLLLQDLTARIATEKPLSWLQIPELPKWHSQMTSVSFVWDPGTRLLQYKFLYTEENTNCHKDIKCYGVALWLIHFQPP